MQSIQINNFRGIKDLNVENIKNFSVFFGTNNCGKSSILESIFVWANAGIPSFTMIPNSFRNLEFYAQNVFQLFYNLDINSTIKITANRNLLDERKVSVSVPDMIPNIQNNKLEFPKINVRIEDSDGERNLFFADDKNDLRGNPIDLIHCVYYSSYFQDKDIYKRISEIIISKQKNQIVEILKQIDSSIIDFQMVNGNQIMFDIGLSQLVRLEVMGDGVKKCLEIITSLLATKNGILLIDELENGFHYSTLKKIISLIFNVAVKNNVQVFFTTHSYECLNTINETIKSLNFEDKINYYRIERNNDEHKSVEISSEQLSVVIEENWEIR